MISAIAANNGTPTTPKPTTTSTLSKLKSWGKWYICGNSPEGAIENWMETGATKGAIGGANAGAGTVGVATFGVGGVPGAALGGVVGGVVGAGAGVIWGGGAAAVCYYAGAYDHPSGFSCYIVRWSLRCAMGLLGLGMVLVIYGTIVKNRWGINLDPVSCPRCNTPFPQIRKPQNVRQALWGGGTCTECGAEVDKWGREVTAQRQPFPSAKPEDQMRRGLKRGLLGFTAVGFFCLTLLFDWLGIRPSVGQMAWNGWPFG